MTVYEFQELMTGVAMLLYSQFALYFTIFSAYLAVVHFIGAKLDKVEAVSLTGIYAVFCLFLIYSMRNQIQRIRDLAEIYLESSGRAISVPQAEVAEAIIVVVFGGAWLISTAYMIKVHRNKNT
ncbi:MAG: hypothetical protein DHS20C12_08240 [Pseudohongiella sp.]|nr:MAG: hypothetical protein DHS20C12_08240 [Pseudohongiella sp.]